jgi:hypothetical protein
MAEITAWELLLTLVSKDLRLPGDHLVELIRHRVDHNWRQRYPTAREKVLALRESLIHEGHHTRRLVAPGDPDGLLTELDSATREGLALSVTSRVWREDGRLAGHLALMNLHPEGFNDVTELREAIPLITNRLPGYLINSGRHYHYYGRRLLPEEDWPRFIAEFLMPCTVTSPRYIGHSIERGFCSLRLNAVPPQKPVIPRLACTI